MRSTAVSATTTMDIEPEIHHRRVPSLVQLCQRAAVVHADSICSLGDDLTYPLVRPILERCSTEQLSRLEQASPHLQRDMAEIWKDLCFRKYRMTAVERYSVDDDPQEPDSWRFRYFSLHDAETKRIDELGSRLRTQRMEAHERKKEKEVKYTDRLPDPKRARTGSSWNTPAKSLFQRTRHEASKYQRTLNTRVLPPPPTSKIYRVLPHSAGAAMPSAAPSSSRVIVNTVIHRRASTSFSAGVSSVGVTANSGPHDKVPVSTPSHSMNPSRKPPSINTPKTPPPVTPQQPLLSDPLRTVVAKPSQTLKKDKDPMSFLFVPKRTAKGQVRRPV